MKWSTANKVGLVLLILWGLTNAPSVLGAQPEGQEGPPFGMLVLDSVLGVIIIVATVVAWIKRSHSLARLACGASVVVLITALPAFVADVPAFIKVAVTVGVIWVVTAVVLTLRPNRAA